MSGIADPLGGMSPRLQKSFALAFEERLLEDAPEQEFYVASSTKLLQKRKEMVEINGALAAQQEVNVVLAPYILAIVVMILVSSSSLLGF